MTKSSPRKIKISLDVKISSPAYASENLNFPYTIKFFPGLRLGKFKFSLHNEFLPRPMPRKKKISLDVKISSPAYASVN